MFYKIGKSLFFEMINIISKMSFEMYFSNMLFMECFIANMYRFNTEGFIFSSVMLVVSIYLIIAGYKKGIKKGSALWQVTFYLSIALLLLVLFLWYIHFSSFQLPY